MMHGQKNIKVFWCSNVLLSLPIAEFMYEITSVTVGYLSCLCLSVD